jgi:glycosyltransferase involved in cell wall biosynthesis
MIEKKSICIISFSPIYRDARVLRQVKYLSSYYDLTVIGYGPPHQDWVNKKNIKWISLELDNFQDHQTVEFSKSKPPNNWVTEGLRSILKQFKSVLSFSLLGLGRLYPRLYEIWYWRTKYRLKTLRCATQSECHAFHANDWEALPVAAIAAQNTNAKLVFDAHEYAPLELENRWYWKPFFKPAITYFIKKYSPTITASVTVVSAISERYKKEFGLSAKVILNAPEREYLTIKHPQFNKIRLIHHGGTIRDRKLENLIETLAFCDERFSLNLLLLNNDANYLNELKRFAGRRAPGRVLFHDAVLPDEIVRRISEYDMGLCLIAPTNFNYLISLPNKFFDYIIAGLAVCVGPSPSMVEMIKRYGFGCVAASFEPRQVADTLNRLTAKDLLRMRSASREAAKKINAQTEMKKLIDLYNQLFG